jgi:hypothetical protein
MEAQCLWLSKTLEFEPKRESPVNYPGIPSVQDGSGAVVWVESHISQAACAYPSMVQGNPSTKEDCFTNPEDRRAHRFHDVLAHRGPVFKAFDAVGAPDEFLLSAQGDQLQNWHKLQELAGWRRPVACELAGYQPAPQGIS